MKALWRDVLIRSPTFQSFHSSRIFFAMLSLGLKLGRKLPDDANLGLD